MDCGSVVAENAIVSEVGFSENTDGSSSVVGQFVSSTGSFGGRARGPTVGGFSRETREQTILNGRRRILQLASALRLGSHHIDAAVRLYMLAVQHNFVQGRKAMHVSGACLYIVCRREQTAHMLIDFADLLQTDVYRLVGCALCGCLLT